MARRLVAGGHSVEWFSASFPGALSNEDMDGIKVVRSGRQWTVHFLAFWRYRRSIRSQFDVVIDEVNTMPFFTPLWAGIPIYMLVFQLAREVWWYESRFPISAFGFLAEPLYLSVYRRTRVLTISKSTESDLRRMGFKGTITIFPIGIKAPERSDVDKSASPSFIFVGRLAPSKRVDHLIEALAHYRDVARCGTLWIVGVGSDSYIRFLKKLARRHGVLEHVHFVGRVSPIERDRLMSQSHALVMASVREGWGLVVTEANSLGTPAIAYDVPGLRDAITDEVTGLLVPCNPVKLSEAMIRLTSDRPLYDRLARNSRRQSAAFSFDASASVVEHELSRIGSVDKSSRIESS